MEGIGLGGGEKQFEPPTDSVLLESPSVETGNLGGSPRGNLACLKGAGPA
jgi:hypothetical protein